MYINRQEQNESLNSSKEEKLELDLGQTIKNYFQDFLDKIAERLEKMEEVLVVDRIEGDFAVCENRNSGKMQSIPLLDLPENIKDGTIIKWSNGKYEIDTSEEIENRIKRKMDDLWRD